MFPTLERLYAYWQASSVRQVRSDRANVGKLVKALARLTEVTLNRVFTPTQLPVLYNLFIRTDNNCDVNESKGGWICEWNGYSSLQASM